MEQPPQNNPLQQVLNRTRDQRNQAADMVAMHAANVDILGAALNEANEAIAKRDAKLEEQGLEILGLRESMDTLSKQIAKLQWLMLPESDRGPDPDELAEQPAPPPGANGADGPPLTH